MDARERARSSPLAGLNEILQGGSPNVAQEQDPATVAARIKEERQCKQFTKKTHPWVFVLVTEIAFFLILGVLLVARPIEVAKVVREAVLGAGKTSGSAQTLQPAAINPDGRVAMFSPTEFLLRVVGIACLSLLVFIVDGIRKKDDSFAISYGSFRIAFSVGLSFLVFTGGREAKMAIPFLLHGLWVAMTILSYGPVSFHLSLRSVHKSLKRARDAAAQAPFGVGAEEVTGSGVQEENQEDESSEGEGEEEEEEEGGIQTSSRGASTSNSLRSPPERLAAAAAASAVS